MNDFLYRGLIKDFNVRFAYAHTTKVSNDLVKTHQACPLVSHIISRAATAGVLCSPTLGEGERYSFTLSYPGPIGKVIIDAGSDADVRATASAKQLMGTVTEEHEIYGDTGSINFMKSDNRRVINNGTCEAPLMDVVSDIAFYFSVSEQLETDMYIAVGFNPDPENPVEICQGILLQAMPDCDHEGLERMRKVLHSDEFKALIAKKPELDNNFEILIKELLKGEEVQPEYEIHSAPNPRFECNCSREKTMRILKTLGPSDVKDIVEKKENVKVACQFCSQTYEFTPQDVRDVTQL
ncbi:MAG: Hsp33 family molecular chaperone HslO [Lentisphaeraceae bacterium]|nr:Hsp33 family molecular chaperone HslO [Lentisphaeraceae bacterium]